MSGNDTGDPSAEPALRVDTREELVYLLGQACEIEHGLMCEYLYAQFSLKRGPDEGLTDSQLARVQAWEKALITVIKQEMLHLALATNILTAIGAAPHFERPNFPILSRWYPPGVQIALVPFGERALRHFIYLDRPEGMALDDAAGFAAARHATPLTAGDSGLAAVPPHWPPVGQLYRGIEAGWRACAPGTARTPCSSGRPGRRRSPTSSSGPNWSRSPTWPRRAARSRRSSSRARGHVATGSGRTSAPSWESSRTCWRCRQPTPHSTRPARWNRPSSGYRLTSRP